MASVSSLRLKSRAPNLPIDPDCPHFFALAACFVLMAPPVTPTFDWTTASLLLLAVCCTAWCFQLQSRSVSFFWPIALTVTVTLQVLLTIVQTSPAPTMRIGVVVSGLMIYFMLWAFSMLHTRRWLQAVAAIALMLALTVLVHPSLLGAAALLSIIFMIVCRRKVGGLVQSAFLVYTPFVLCVLILLALYAMGIVSVRRALPPIDLPWPPPWHYDPLFGARLHGLIPALIFAFGTLLGRLFDGRSALTDFAFATLLLCLLTNIALLPAAPDAAVLVDSGITIYAGAMCLLAPGLPHALLARALVLMAAASALAFKWLAISNLF